MDYKLEKRIEVNYEPTNCPFNNWCLNEYDENNNKIGKDLVPYAFSVYFICSSLKVVRQTFLRTDSEDGDRKKVKQKAIVTGTIHSGFCRDGETLTDVVSYSFFGTKRKIEKFNVSITEANDEQDEYCTLVGIPSYTTEIDFVDATEPDFLGFDVYLKKERFEALVTHIESKAVDSCWMSASLVSGFYSEWSPSISTNFIKVLTPSHDLEGLDKDKFQPKRVGEVRDFSFHFTSMHKLNLKQQLIEKINIENEFEPEIDDIDFATADEIASKHEMQAQQKYAESTALAVKLASSLKVPLWFIFIALVLLLLK